jgi:hypothetical protein
MKGSIPIQFFWNPTSFLYTRFVAIGPNTAVDQAPARDAKVILISQLLDASLFLSETITLDLFWPQFERHRFL